MESKTLQLFSREEIGKGAAKKIRKEGKIPAVIYGHNAPLSVAIDAREFGKKFHTVSENTIITLQGEKDSYDVLVKDYQDDIITDFSEFKLCIGNNDALFCCQFGTFFINSQTQGLCLLSQFGTDQIGCFFKIDVDIVSHIRFGGRGEDRFR